MLENCKLIKFSFRQNFLLYGSIYMRLWSIIHTIIVGIVVCSVFVGGISWNPYQPISCRCCSRPCQHCFTNGETISSPQSHDLMWCLTGGAKTTLCWITCVPCPEDITGYVEQHLTVFRTICELIIIVFPWWHLMRIAQELP